MSKTIREASWSLKIGEASVRKAIQRGDLPAELVRLEGSKVERYEIEEADIEAYRVKMANNSIRSDGRNRYLSYFTPEEYRKAQIALSKAGLQEVAALIKRDNKKASNKED